MIIDEQPVRFGWGTVVRLSEFPELLARFQQNVPSKGNKPTTSEIEQLAIELAKNNFREADLQSFIKTVCHWGGYAGIAGRVIRNNSGGHISATFRKAYQKAQNGSLVEALEALRHIKDLRSVSFASKHLKFLAPDSAVVLDSIISERLAYQMNSAGYRDFLADCRTILQNIVAFRLEYSGWGKSGWRISDVEMAITAKLRF
jgi:hypothetical protein